MEKLYIKTVFKDLLEGLDGIYTSISLFNFRSGMKKFNLDDPIRIQLFHKEQHELEFTLKVVNTMTSLPVEQQYL